MKEIRLLPVLVACGGALLLLKLSGLALTGHYVLPLPAIGPALAQAPAPDTAAGSPPPEAPAGEATQNDAQPSDAAAEGAADQAGEDTAKAGEEQESAEPVQGRIVKPGEDVVGAKAAVLERLGERRVELDQREKDLDMREALLNAAEARIAARVSELKEIEARVTAAVQKKDAEKKAQLKSLVTMYETMKPKDAARIFSELNLNVLVDVVEQMNARKMAEVLANMEVKAAERLTLALAARSREQSFPTEPQELPKIEGRPQSAPQG